MINMNMIIKSFLILTATTLQRSNFTSLAYKTITNNLLNTNKSYLLRTLCSINNQFIHQNQKSSIICKSADDIELLGGLIANIVDDVDVLFLQGDLGAGKTTFSRGLIRGMFGDQDMIVTSPSYLLDNCYQYDENSFIHHIDLYRLPIGCDMNILNIPTIFTTSLCIIEWPNRLTMNIYPESYLEVNLSITKDEEQHRTIHFKTIGTKWINKQNQLNNVLENSTLQIYKE